MKSLYCKEVLGTRTYSGASNYLITKYDVPAGTKRIMATFTEEDEVTNYVYVNYGETSVILNSKNLYYFDWIWSNEDYNLNFNKLMGNNINNLTVVYLR